MTALFRLSTLSLALAASTLSACAYLGGQVEEPPATARAAAQADTKPAAVTPAAKPAETAAAVAQASAADAALADGLKAYQAGQYKQAEVTAALKAGLSAPADIVSAQKHLAFIYCTSKRDTQCVAAFKAAKAADPGFALSKAEAGHPMWSRTYKKALGLK